MSSLKLKSAVDTRPKSASIVTETLVILVVPFIGKVFCI